jgi:hypothetical protein
MAKIIRTDIRSPHHDPSARGVPNYCRPGLARKSNFWSHKSALAVLKNTPSAEYLNDPQNQYFAAAGLKIIGK